MDGRGDVTGLLVQDPAGRNVKRPPLRGALRSARKPLLASAPLQEVVSAVVAEASSAGFEIGVGLVRISQSESRVEILNAGMPPIACSTEQRVFVYSPRSRAVGRDDDQGHPYEVVPLVWGSTWLLASSGLTGGSLLPDPVQHLCERLELRTRGLELATQTPDELRDTLIARNPDSRRCARDDATLVLIAADPHARLQSGIH